MPGKVKDWITVNGVHVPIYDGESKEDAAKRSIKMQQDNIKKNQKEKEKQIKDNEDQANKKLNLQYKGSKLGMSKLDEAEVGTLVVTGEGEIYRKTSDWDFPWYSETYKGDKSTSYALANLKEYNGVFEYLRKKK